MMPKLPLLPLSNDLETIKILKKADKAGNALSELKGYCQTLPNPAILINTLMLQEAKDSSAIENIITTHDDIFKADVDIDHSVAAKEVNNYSKALHIGFDIVKNDKLITNRTLLKMHKKLEGNDAGFRRQSGTQLKNDATGEIVYTPPQDPKDVLDYMTNLEKYINEDGDDLHVLVKMAVIHYQFESIHPFYDGNGRIGRMINILYLIAQGLLDYPILYLSRYIIQNKQDYYRLLQNIHETNDWESWILYMLDALEVTAQQTIALTKAIMELFAEQKHYIRENFKKFYSHDLLNNLFIHPYTKIDNLAKALGVQRNTASKYLNALAEDDVLVKIPLGSYHYFFNHQLYNLIQNFDYNLKL